MLHLLTFHSINTVNLFSVDSITFQIVHLVVMTGTTLPCWLANNRHVHVELLEWLALKYVDASQRLRIICINLVCCFALDSASDSRNVALSIKICILTQHTSIFYQMTFFTMSSASATSVMLVGARSGFMAVLQIFKTSGRRYLPSYIVALSTSHRYFSQKRLYLLQWNLKKRLELWTFTNSSIE